jgi:serine/threonine protein kinase
LLLSLCADVTDSLAQNILVGSDHRIRLADFATCLLLDVNGGVCKKAFVGSAQYVAPEIIAGAEMPTDKVDVWAIGCVAFFLVYGTHAFLRENDYHTWNAALKEPLTLPFSLADADYVWLLDHCLAKDPDTRPSAAELCTRFAVR